MTSVARFAHKPVCEATRARLLRVGRTAVCRGCTMLWLGVAFGVVGAARTWAGALLGAALLLLGLAGLHPSYYAAMPNPARDVSRFALGAGPLLLVAGAWRAGLWYPACVVLWFSGLFALRAMRVRRSRPRHRCEACVLHGS